MKHLNLSLVLVWLLYLILVSNNPFIFTFKLFVIDFLEQKRVKEVEKVNNFKERKNF